MIRCSHQPEKSADPRFLKPNKEKKSFYDASIIPDAQINEFREMLEKAEKADKPVTIETGHFKLGDMVRVKNGALAGQKGNIIVDPHGCYLVISLNILGYAKVQIDPKEVEKLED